MWALRRAVAYSTRPPGESFLAAASYISLAEGSIGRDFCRMTLPVGCGLLATMGAQLIVTAFVGSLGVAPLAAISFTFPVVMIVVNMGIGLAAGTSAVVARDLGGNQ